MQKTNRISFILTTLFIFPLPQLAIDLYLPSLPAMAVFFNESKSQLQLTLTLYMVSLGISQLIYGPCSDRFGRKPTLIIGTFIFLLGSIGCALSSSINQLFCFRIVQGLGMGAGFSIGSAIIGDCFIGADLARMTTFSSMIYSLSPIIAPALGGYFQHYLGWQANFIFIALATLLLFFCILFYIPETNRNKNRHAVNPKVLLINCFNMFKNIKFIGNLITLTLAFGVMVTFNIVGPFLLQNILHVSVIHYGQLLLLVGAAYCIGTIINSWVVNYFAINTLIIFGIFLMLLFSIMLILVGYFGSISVFTISLFTCLQIFSTGFVFPNCFANALEVFPEMMGTATAVIGSTGLFGTSFISIIISQIHNYEGPVLGYMFFLQAILAAFAMTLVLLSRKK